MVRVGCCFDLVCLDDVSYVCELILTVLYCEISTWRFEMGYMSYLRYIGVCGLCGLCDSSGLSGTLSVYGSYSMYWVIWVI